NRANYTTYSGRKIMIAPVTTSAGANTGVKLYDITSGLASPSNITTSGTTLSSASTTYTAAHSYVNGDDLIMYLVKDNTIVRFAPTEGSTVVDTSPIRGIFAYGLSSTVNDDDSYTFTYGANNNATETYIVFNDATTGTQVGRVKVANAVMSRQRNANTFNSVTLTQDQIPGSEGQILNWSVELKGRPVAATGTRLNNLSNTTNKYNYTRIGIAVDNSPESDHFGYVYVVDRVGSSNANNSITQWFQGTTDTQDSNYSDWGFTGKYTSTTKFHNPFRAAVDDKGTVYLADYGDGANSGIRIFQPETMETSTQLFIGTNNSSTGAWTTSGGVFVGGSCAGVAITGSGANKVLYTTIEDNADQKNQIAVYNIGNATTWGTAPSRYISTGGIILNGNQCLYADDKGGVWISQYRYGTANDYGVPALIYIDDSGSITCNMGYQNSTLKGCHAAGFAVSPDNSLLAVINGSSEICLYSLAWSGTTPTPTYITKFTCEATGGTTTNAVYQMAFDWGGNLYAGGTKLVVYSIADAENRHTTPAKKVLTVTKLGSRSLAQIANGSNVVVNTKYRISNTDLVCVYVDKTAQTIYCKDNNQAANKSYLAEGQTDYLYKVGLQTTEPDQSNWVAVHLPQALTAAQISAMVNHNVTIKAGTVNVKGGNNEITLTTMPIPGSTATYTPNTYITANFVSENWSNPDFFFVKPKPMEYAIVKWAVWDADNNVFVIPAKQGGNNIAGLHGGFAINTSLEETNYSFVDGQLYTLEGIVMAASGGSGAPRRVAGDNSVISSDFVFYPTIATNDTPTDINTILVDPAHREVVAVKYFNLMGMEFNEVPDSGVYIEVTYYSDGSHESVKKQAHR
ncbi:MAG: hypothetical protein IK092_00990, partial [Muribaculaceae bacterium]|nr:hypothetical protein [Muribaculaceae bacterium]